MAQPTNNICTKAIELTVDLDDGCFGTGEFPINNATPSSVKSPSCELQEKDPRKDIWFKFSANTSDLRVALDVPLAFDPLKSFTMTLYRGGCAQLQEIGCHMSSDDAFNVLRVDSLRKGEELFLRLGTPIDTTGSFQLCLIFYPDSTQLIDCQDLIIDPINDTIIDNGERIRFQGKHEPLNLPARYNWYHYDTLICSDCAEVTLAPQESTIYTFKASYGNCIVEDDIVVTVLLSDEQKSIYAPNAFTPNGDGVNDRFQIHGGDQIKTILDLAIYNRWGELVYQNVKTPISSTDHGWDGTFNNKVLENGIFVYFAIIEFEDGSTKQFKGTFQLMK